MEIIENKKVKEKMYSKKLENGLTIMIIPKKNVTKKYVIWGTNYGSIDSKFIVPGEKEETEVPDGVAHFLEHKMFEQENGTNSLDVLTALGANANAYTTNDHTAYLFESTDNFYEALDELMDYVQNPYFTDENVEKEKGIIGQEIMMYDDYPEWCVYINALKAMYKDNPINIDITGTKETIGKIDKDVLYKCYNTFYHPSNMALVVCGDVEPEEMFNEIEKRITNKANQATIKRIYPVEQKEVVTNYIEKDMKVSIPLFIIGVKDEVADEGEKVKKHIAIELLLNLLTGKSSELYKKLYNENLLQEVPDSSYEFAKNYAYVLIQGTSSEPEKVLESLKKELERLKKEGINQEDYDRTKKMLYATYIKEYNSVEDISRAFLADFFKGINSFDYLEEYSTVTKEYVMQVLEDVFQEDRIILSVIK